MDRVIKERPILFTGPMVRALLDGSKTQTRRIAKEFAGRADLDAILRRFPQQRGCPHGEVGARLWVKESYRLLDSFDGDSATRVAERCIDAGYPTPWAPIQYEADSARHNWQHVSTPPRDGPPKAGKLRPSIFMPRWASRILLEITGVRVERLNDCSNDDALAEGVKASPGGMWSAIEGQAGTTPRAGYALLWESINGAGTWAANPWVWVVEFKRVTPC